MKKITIVSGLMLMAPVIAFAQTSSLPTLPGGFTAIPIPETLNLYETIQNILYFLFALLMAVAAIFIVFAAFLYLTSGGDEEKLGKAKNYLVYAIIAVVVGLAGQGLLRIATTLLVTG